MFQVGGTLFNNREIATAIFLAVVVAMFIVVPQLRRSVGPGATGVVKAIFVPRLIVVFSAFLLWASGWIVLASVVGIWDVDLLKDSIIIVLALGFPMLIRSVRLTSGPSIARNVIVESLGLSALLAFYINLAPFPLWAELIAQPLLTLVVALQALSKTKNEWAKAHSVLSGVLIASGVIALVWTTAQVTLHFSELDLLGLLRSFTLSVALPIVLIPFFYLTAFHAFSEVALVRMKLRNPNMPRRVAWAIWLGLGLRLSLAAKLTGRHNVLGEARGFRDALRRMATFRAEES